MNMPPKNHTWVQTLDGSRTLFSERFQEACHSTAGARTETVLHYLQGCRVEEKAQQKNINILEVGLGLGVGFLTTLETLKSSPYQFHFLSLEIDLDLISWVVEKFQKDNFIHSVSKITYDDYSVVKATFSNGTLTILGGDARIALPDYLKRNSLFFDVIYQDAFSPKKNPTLWTVEWFELLKKYSDAEVRLSTYSASSSIRKSLVEAGWKLHPGEKFGPKRTSTRATLTGYSDPEIMLHLERSPTPALTDLNIETK